MAPGAGPTGVEFAAELHDLLHSEMERYYPILSRFAKITLYDTADHILGSFDKSLVKCASIVATYGSVTDESYQVIRRGCFREMGLEF